MKKDVLPRLSQSSLPETRCLAANVAVLGRGLHPAVQFKWLLSVGQDTSVSDDTSSEIIKRIEILVLQLLPAGAYLDLDELRARHDFRLRAMVGCVNIDDSTNIVNKKAACSEVPIQVTGVASGSHFIDIEQPAHVSYQHTVEIALSIEAPMVSFAKRTSLSVELNLPFHVRYPKPEFQRKLAISGGSEFSGASVNPAVLFIRQLQSNNTSTGVGAHEQAQSLRFVPLEMDHNAYLQHDIFLEFPAGEGWRVGAVVVITAAVHVAGFVMIAIAAFA
jgi:hypothetical protein